MGFLTDLVSLAGRNAIVTMKGGVVRNHWTSFADTSQARAIALRAADRGEDTYFALGAYNPDAALTRVSGRSAANVVALRSFWLDVDAGEAKWEAADERRRRYRYRTFEDALEGISASLRTSGLVKPTHIVASGTGVHLYWALTDDLPPDLWRKVAKRLGEVLTAHGLKIDPSRTCDPASILRPVGTLHQGATAEAGTDVHVKLLKRREPLAIEELVASIKAAMPRASPVIAPAPRPAAPAPVPPAKERVAEKLTQERLAASSARATRPPPADTPENREKLQRLLEHVPSSCGYEDWRRVIWAVQSLVDAGWDKLFTFTLLHEWSEAGAPDDDWEAAFVKVLRSNDREYGAKKVSIGSLVAMAEAEGMPDGFHFDEPGTTTAGKRGEITSTVDGLEVTYAVPEMPKNFFRRKGELGIWTRVKVEEDDEDEEGGKWEEIQFLGCDLHIIDRSVDSEGTETLMVRLQHRMGGATKTFFVPSALVYSGDGAETQKAFAAKGVLPLMGKKGWVLTVRYLQEQARLMMIEKDATRSIDNFGWQDDGAFVLGKVAVRPDGTTVPVVPSAPLVPYADSLMPKGTLEAWKEVAALYAYPGLEAAQLPILMSMGAPLYKHTGVTGGVFNLYSQSGGHGKTPVLCVAMSVWGDPDHRKGLVKGTNTGNALFLKMGHMGSLPCMFDEITARGGPNLNTLRDFVLHSTDGVGKSRMQSGANALRANTTVWSTFAMTTANRSMNALCSGEDSSHAEQRRAIDIPFPVLGALTTAFYPIEHVHHCLKKVLPKNYGTAGHELAKYYLAHPERTQELVLEKIALLSEACASRSMRGIQEFQISMLSVALAARDIAEELGIVQFDRERMEQFCKAQLTEQQQTLRDNDMGGEDIFNSFLRHNAARVIHTKRMHSAVVLCGTQQYPRDAVAGRWETDTNTFSIVRSELKAFCAEHRFDIRNVEAWLESIGAMREANTAVLLSRGLVGYNSGVARCYVVDAAKVGLVPEPEGETP